MRYILMLIGTILSILFIVHLIKGKKYSNLVENLDGNVFPLNTIYIVGFSWGNLKMFAFKGKKASELKAQATFLYEPQYAEYYANIVWAQRIAFVHLFLSITFLISGMLYDSALLMLVAGGFMTLVIYVYCTDNMKNQISERTMVCEQELPEVVSTLAILVNSGMVLREAWTIVSENKEGEFYDLMKKATLNMNNGYSDADAIYLFGKYSDSVEIKKFTSALIQSIEKGGGELGVFLAQQSTELWNGKRQRMLQAGEKAATKLLLPIVLIFVGIMLIVITAAFAGALF